MSFIIKSHPYEKPHFPRRSFAENITKFRTPNKSTRKRVRSHNTNYWPGTRLDYEFLERCKELVCRVDHPTALYTHRKVNYRVSILRWSHGAYIDIRKYYGDTPRAEGVLLHIDILGELLPEISAALRQLQIEDVRDDDKKAHVEIIRG